MTRHISLPAAKEGLGTAARGKGAATGVSAGSETEATRDCVATLARRGRLRPTTSNRTPAAPATIHFRKRCAVASSGGRRWDGGNAGASSRTTVGGTETGDMETGGTETGDEMAGGGAGGGAVGGFRAALISARVQRVCGFGSAA